MPRPPTAEELAQRAARDAEVVRLRTQEKLVLKDIATRLKLAVPTVSKILVAAGVGGYRRSREKTYRSPIQHCCDVLGAEWVINYCDERVRAKADPEEHDEEWNLALERLFTALRLVDLDAEEDLREVRARLRERRRGGLEELAFGQKFVAEEPTSKKDIPTKRDVLRIPDPRPKPKDPHAG